MLRSFVRGTTLVVGLAAAAVYAGRVYTQAPPDETAPFVAISSPATDEIVSGSVTITADTSDNVGTAAVQFVLNGMPLGAEDTSAPFSIVWNASESGIGAHVLSAIARDDAGNAADSELMPVIVGIGVPPPPPPPPPDNRFPVALSDAMTSTSGAPVTFTAAMLTGNDSDPDGDAILVTDVGAAGTAGGTVVDNGGGRWTYTPPASFTGSDTFTYSISDGHGGVASAIVNITVTPPPSGLVAAFSFDEASGATVSDVSGHGNHGTISGAARVSGRFGRALSFDGVDDLVSIADSASLALASGATIEAWVRPTLLSGWRTVALKESATGLAYALYAHDDVPRPAFTANFGGDDVSAPGAAALPVGAWSHLAATYDGAAMRLYVNGTLVRTRAATGTFISTSQPLRIGGNAVWGEYFAGSIDQVRIYDRALTAAQIVANSQVAVAAPPPPVNTAPIANADALAAARDTALTIAAGALLANDADADGDPLIVASVDGATAAGGTITANGASSWIYTPPSGVVGSDSFAYTINDGRGGTATGNVTITISAPSTGLVGAWGFNENAGTSAADGSGNGRTGTIRQAQWVPSGKYGAALAFDGIDDWVTVADHASLDLTTGMTIEAWVKPGAMTGWETLVMKERGAGDFAYALYAHDGGSLAGGAPVPSGNVRAGGGQQTLRGTTTLPSGEWTHVATTYNGATQRLFVNGVEVASRPQTGPIAVSGGVLRIGGNNSWSGEFFQGQIDEVRVYNRALTQPEIAADMATAIP
jgi:hypothetical protein